MHNPPRAKRLRLRLRVKPLLKMPLWMPHPLKMCLSIMHPPMSKPSMRVGRKILNHNQPIVGIRQTLKCLANHH
jgi:hypothetical protein